MNILMSEILSFHGYESWYSISVFKKWKQQDPSKRWYPTTSLYGVATRKTSS